MSADLNFMRNMRKQEISEAASPLLKLKEAEYILAMKRSQEASLYRETSVSGGASSGSVRRKLAAIRSRVLSGGRLSASEKQFLRRYAPELYSRYLEMERERQAEKELAERRKRQLERESAELKKRAAEKRRLEKERQKEARERMVQEHRQQEKISDEIREYEEYTRSFHKGYSTDTTLHPIMPGPDETRLGIVGPEIAGLPEAASMAVRVSHEMESARAAGAWMEKKEGQKAQTALHTEQNRERRSASVRQDRKKRQNTDMEWSGKDRKEMEALQEAAEAQAAETRTSLGRAAYRTSAGQTALPVDSDRKTCNRKA